MKTFAVILAGCGAKDGSEIHESVLTMYAIKSLGADYTIFAPSGTLKEVNHIDGSTIGMERNILYESARIARGNIFPLTEFNEENFDALVIPGGFGTMKNLCNYAAKGTHFEVNKDVENAVLSMYNAGKPIGFICITPIIAAKLIPGSILTLGNDEKYAEVIEAMDCEHAVTECGEVCIDRDNNLFSTACYMFDTDISMIGKSVTNLVEAILESC